MWLIFLLVFIILLSITIRLSLKTDLIRDVSSASDKPFSLSKTQLAFWTVVITSSYFYLLYLADFDFSKVEFSNSALILLGVSISTAVGGRMIDVGDQDRLIKAKISSRHQDEESEGFWKDILSDANGYSIARYQHVVYTLVLGVGFIINVVINEKMIDFDPNMLTLAGVSSVGYLGIKRNENI